MFWLQSSDTNSEEPSTLNTHVKIEVPSELLKVSLVNKSLKKLIFHLANFDKVVKVRTTPNANNEGSWDFEHTKKVFVTEIIPWLNKLKEFFNEFDKGLLDEITEVHVVFTQMEAAVKQCSIDRKCYIVNLVLNHFVVSCESVTMNDESVNTCKKCLELKAKFIKKNDVFNELSKQFSNLEQHCISLEVAIQLNQEIFLKDKSCDTQSNPEIQDYFEQNDLKAQLQAKDTIISTLKEKIHALRDNPDRVKQDIDEIETINIELEHTLKNELRKLQGKDVIDIAVSKPKVTTIAPGMFKITVEPLPPKLFKNKEAHIDYIQQSREHANVLREIVEDAKALSPLDSNLDSACKERLIAVTPKNKDTKVRPADPVTSSKPSAKLGDVTPINKDKKVRVICSPDASGSNPTGNTKTNRISQPSSSNKTNKVEETSRSVKSRKNKMNRVAKAECNAVVMQSMLNTNSKSIC
ncbi:hypothetical protein Tco_1477855, partial [Tanacetum coccineum]